MKSPDIGWKPLRLARVGETVTVCRLAGQRVLCQRLREMGFCENMRLRVMHNNGTIVCQVCGSRVGLSLELAESIFVEPIEGLGNSVVPGSRISRAVFSDPGKAASA